MPSNPVFTRRQILAGIGASSLLPYSSVLAAAENKMRGAFMILSTPYTADNEVDYEDLAKEVAFCAKCGVQGLVWPQNSSEQRYLSKEERIKGFQTLAEANRGTGMALVLGVQADDTEGMLDYARIAETLHPDGMIAIPPTTANTLEDIRNYYRALCEVTDKPVFVQTSGGSDIELTVEFLVELARELPQCGYIKEEYGRVQERMLALQKFQPDPIRSVLGATFGRGWLYEMRLGTDGVMTGGAMYADVFAKLWEYHLAGNEESLRDCYSKLLLISNLDSLIPGVRLFVLQKRGIFKTIKSRRGDYEFSAQQIEEIEYRFESLKPYLIV
ncbi:MAG: dihydrodipicolinate synthase family protein [Gammaproteobacteria bacterium]|nr:dihydrodipicolinate synthase family protein [Gammaproteobacteria bacterium]MDD9959361.1 dihydrodipicolinate synthase family protein [Gammaproteobacteria bacterium]